MPVAQVRTEWSGGPGGAGLTLMHLRYNAAADMAAALLAVRTFWNGVRGALPDDYTLTVQPSAEIFDETTGALQGTSAIVSGLTPVVGQNVGAYAAGVGYRISWRTGVIRGNRRVRGATYCVPIIASLYADGGVLSPTLISTHATFAQTLITDLATAGLPLAIWGKPSTALPVGVLADVDGGNISNKVAILRGRRD